MRVPSLAVIAGLMLVAVAGCQPGDPGTQANLIATDADDIAGVVRSSAGTEAGVWVIAETEDFGTRFARIVVTDDQGRFLIPDLPAANYQLWVRGYGLQDSAKVAATLGENIDLTAIVAADAAIAAQVYPAAYWYAMLGLPTDEEVAEIPGGVSAAISWGNYRRERCQRALANLNLPSRPGRVALLQVRQATAWCASPLRACMACQ